jgi:hypothetical protein
MLGTLLYLSHRSDGVASGCIRRRFLDSLASTGPNESLQIVSKLQSATSWRTHQQKPFTPTEPAELTSAVSSEASSESNQGKVVSSQQSSASGEEHAPWHANWRNSVAICAIMRQENITDVVEWLSYYRYVPVSRGARLR